MRKNRKWIFGIKTGIGMVVHMEEEEDSVSKISFATMLHAIPGVLK
jgi:hypothetical protein